MINHELYNCLSKDFKDYLNKCNIVREYHKGQNLFWEGDSAKYVYYIKSGHVKVYKTSEDGHETIFSLYPFDSFVALGVVFNPNKHYPASAQAVSDAIVYEIEVSRLEQAIISSQEASRTWLGYMNNRLTLVQNKLSDQIFADGMQRLKKLVKYFYENYPSQSSGKFKYRSQSRKWQSY